MNLYDIVVEVLEHANNEKMSIENEISRESIATEIYELFYESQVYSPYASNGYIENLDEYWQFREDFDEDE